MRRRSILILATATLAGCAANGPGNGVIPGEQVGYNDKKTVDQALAGLVPGKPETCLPFTRTPASSAYGSTVLYRFSADKVYRNDLGPGCEGLGRGDIMVAVTPQGRFCRGDIIRTVDQTSQFQTGGCAFNDFIPYTRPK